VFPEAKTGEEGIFGGGEVEKGWWGVDGWNLGCLEQRVILVDIELEDVGV
jgi:hypothetical protein